jgi:hypothetical protein
MGYRRGVVWPVLSRGRVQVVVLSVRRGRVLLNEASWKTNPGQVIFISSKQTKNNSIQPLFPFLTQTGPQRLALVAHSQSDYLEMTATTCSEQQTQLMHSEHECFDELKRRGTEAE